MPRLILLLATLLTLAPRSAPAQSFGPPTALTPVPVPRNMAAQDSALLLIEAYFDQTGPRDLFIIQLALNGSGRNIALTTDGRWGPMTRAALARDLDTYAAINGYGANGAIRSIQDVPPFLSWVTAAAYANANPDTAEFPD